MPRKFLKNSFLAGEIAPEYWGQVDSEVYKAGLKTAENILIDVAGSAYSRPGLKYVGGVKYQTTATAPNGGVKNVGARFIKFALQDGEAYVLELGHYYMRFWLNDEVELEDEQDISSVTRGSITSITSNSHGLATGDEVYRSMVSGGTTELNGRHFRIERTSANAFRLKHTADDSNIVSTNYGVHTGSSGHFQESI